MKLASPQGLMNIFPVVSGSSGLIMQDSYFPVMQSPRNRSRSGTHSLIFPTSFQPVLYWTVPEITPNNCQWCLHLFLSPVPTIPSRGVLLVPTAFPLHLGNIRWVKLALYAHRLHHTSHSWDVEFHRKNVGHQLVLINWKQFWLPVLFWELCWVFDPIWRGEALPGKKAVHLFNSLFISQLSAAYHMPDGVLAAEEYSSKQNPKSWFSHRAYILVWEEKW